MGIVGGEIGRVLASKFVCDNCGVIGENVC